MQEQVVGPTLGAENINSGIASLAIAFIVIFILMLVYYNTGGIVANIALILNILFTVGILSALHATLTMPGIAGLVLTIGMAVDTNVIIFERIKEELSLGKGYQQAVNDGYKRSYCACTRWSHHAAAYRYYPLHLRPWPGKGLRYHADHRSAAFPVLRYPR